MARAGARAGPDLMALLFTKRVPWKLQETRAAKTKTPRLLGRGVQVLVTWV